jgi:cysteine desulfurase
VQGVGKIPVQVDALGVDLLSLTAHKMYGPKGVGALYARMGRPRVRLIPQMDGGGHEKGRRSGTLNVPGIVGLGKACELAARRMAAEAERLTALRERLRAGLFARLSHLHLNGHPTERLPGNLNVAFEFVQGESLLMSLNDVALSSGSACSSASPESSHVLRAIGLGDDLGHASLRFSLGRGNTEEEVDYVVGRVVEEVTRLRALV